MNARVINRLPDEIDEDGTVVPVAECICGAMWYGDGENGLGNSQIPDGTDGISLDDWSDHHTCFDDETRQCGKQMIRDIIEIRELLPSVTTKAQRLCNAASNVIQASLYGSQFVVDELADFARVCAGLNQILHHLDDTLIPEDEREDAAIDDDDDFLDL
jgi:hypothetical protein